MNFKYFVIILSIACTFFLYFLSTLSEPSFIQLDDIPNYEEKQVIVEGIVTEHHTTSYGGQIIEIKDKENEKITGIIFVEEIAVVEYGDTIRAIGKVQKYKGDWEIVVNNKKEVQILQKWSNLTTPLWQLAENPNKYIGTNVNITGIIDREYDTYFYLVDPEEQYTITVYYDSSRFYNFSQGHLVCVGGRFTYDTESLRFVISAQDETHHIYSVGEK